MPWRIEFEGEVLREGDLTLGQAERIEKRTEKSWLRVHPLMSAADAIATLTVLYADAVGKTEDEVAEQIRDYKVEALLDAYHVDEDDTPSEYTDGFPPQADGPSTSS